MLDELLESKTGRERRGGGALVSVAAHATAVILAVVATGSATPGPEPEKPPEVLIRIAPPEPRPREPVPTPPRPGTTAGGRSQTAPPVPIIDEVRPGIPPVDIGVDPMRNAFTDPPARPAGGGEGSGDPSGEGPAFPWQVDKVALLLPGSPSPRYPEGLQHSGVEGEVVAQFVVDSAGRVDPGSITILRADDERFARAVRDALRAMRFAPAEAGGRKVAQLVQLPFQFTIAR
jgi:periplasmic protein TonB